MQKIRLYCLQMVLMNQLINRYERKIYKRGIVMAKLKHKEETVVSIATFLIISIIFSGLYIITEKQSIAQNRERYRYIAASQSNRIRACADTVLARVYTLSALVNDNNGDTDFFERQAERIYKETEADTGVTLKNIALAPNGIVEKVFPETGNEALVGFDFMDESKAGNAEAIAAYQRGELIATNPFELVQGGNGMAGRLPVFLTDNGSTKFWGLVTVTMDFDELLKSIDMKVLSNMGNDYELWYKDEQGKRVVMDASENAPQKSVSYEFAINNLVWHLDVAPSEGWLDYAESCIAFLFIAAFALLITLLVLNRIQIKKANEKLLRLAHLDSLTSCYSRHYVNTILLSRNDGEWNDPSVKYSLAIVDIDNFKSINDTYGHDTGDRAIMAIAQVLLDNSKGANGDCVIRHGGDEFIILFNDVTRERFVDKLESIVKDVRNIHFADIPSMHLSVSIGGEYYSGKEESRYYTMVRKADEKLYTAKENGRNQYIL